MNEFFAVMLKKRVEAPAFLPYMLTDDAQVGSWVLTYTLDPRPVAEKLVSVSSSWEVTDVEMVDCDHISPNFSVYPVTVYGVVGEYSPTPGTTHYNWFYPKTVVPYNSPVPAEFANVVTAKSTVYMNWLYSEPLFVKHELLS